MPDNSKTTNRPIEHEIITRIVDRIAKDKDIAEDEKTTDVADKSIKAKYIPIPLNNPTFKPD